MACLFKLLSFLNDEKNDETVQLPGGDPHLSRSLISEEANCRALWHGHLLMMTTFLGSSSLSVIEKGSRYGIEGDSGV